MAAVLSCPGGDGSGLGPLLEGGPARPQDSVRTVTQGRDNKHELKSLKRTGRQIKGFGLSGAAGAKKLSFIILLIVDL